MRMAARSREKREEVVEKWDAAEGARVVMKFLKAELEEMGPTYLERAAEAAIAAAATEAARGGNEEGGGIQEEQGELGLSSMEVDDARREAGIIGYTIFCIFLFFPSRLVCYSSHVFLSIVMNY